MPRRVHLKKESVPEIPLVETVGEDVQEQIKDTVKSAPSLNARTTTRIPRKKTVKKKVKIDERAELRQSRFDKFIQGTQFGSDSILYEFAPDMVLAGWNVFVQCSNIPEFGQPITATFTLLRGEERSVDELSLSTTITTYDLLGDAPAVVCCLVELHRSLNGEDDEE